MLFYFWIDKNTAQAAKKFVLFIEMIIYLKISFVSGSFVLKMTILIWKTDNVLVDL